MIKMLYILQAAFYKCGYGEKRNADWIERSRLDTVLRQLSRYIRPARLGKNSIELNAGLHFTGGEPFLNYELLRDAVERASS